MRRAAAKVIDLVILNVAEAVAGIFFTVGVVVMTGASGTAAEAFVRRMGHSAMPFHQGGGHREYREPAASASIGN